MLSLSGRHLSPGGNVMQSSIVLMGKGQGETVAISPGEERVPHNGELSGHLQSLF